jgi:hypothetical protein
LIERLPKVGPGVVKLLLVRIASSQLNGRLHL